MAADPATSNSSFARWRRRRNARHVSAQAPIILGGCPRSGTTLLRVMLDSHARIACGPECSLLTGGFLPEKLARRFDTTLAEVWRLHDQAADHAQFIELFLADYAARRGKVRWAEKTPQNVRHLDWIFRHFPQAKFVHVIRDGRDAVCSIRTHPRFRLVDGQRVETGIRRPLRPCIEQWVRDTGAGLQWRDHPRYREVRYEDLVGAPEPTLRGLGEFLEEPWDEAMLRYHEQQGGSRDPDKFVANPGATAPLQTTAVGRWRREFTPADTQLFASLASTRMAELGYKSDEES